MRAAGRVHREGRQERRVRQHPGVRQLQAEPRAEEDRRRQALAPAGCVACCPWCHSRARWAAPDPASPAAGVPKLDDANDAGGRNSERCTLILTEGDSAKALAISGLAVVGRDSYGVFPLRGKLLNVRDASAAQVGANAEITALKQILGLQHGKKYSDAKSLRCAAPRASRPRSCPMHATQPRGSVAERGSAPSARGESLGVTRAIVQVRPHHDHDRPGPGRQPYQGPYYELPAPLLPLSAPRAGLPARVHHAHRQGAPRRRLCAPRAAAGG